MASTREACTLLSQVMVTLLAADMPPHLTHLTRTIDSTLMGHDPDKQAM